LDIRAAERGAPARNSNALRLSFEAKDNCSALRLSGINIAAKHASRPTRASRKNRTRLVLR
jgi:hypothetical protein